MTESMLTLATPDGKALPLFDKTIRSPILDALDLRANEESLERATGVMQQLASFAVTHGLRSILRQRLQCADNYTWLELQQEIGIKPTHVKYLLAAAQSHASPEWLRHDGPIPPEKVGYRLFANFYLGRRSIQSLFGRFGAVGPSVNPNYVQTLHTHSQHLIGAVDGKYQTTEYRYKGEIDSKSYDDQTIEFWQRFAATTNFARRQRVYGKDGHPMIARANDVHAISCVLPGTVSFALELPPSRSFSTTFEETGKVRKKLKAKEVIPTKVKTANDRVTQGTLQESAAPVMELLSAKAATTHPEASHVVELLYNGLVGY
ncbi:MAG TPA: hypothetical protein VLF60_04205 [Candidatus Saccharimonadales bacterium]|nr:hypothetical protein [Candidatus Saccharimonadales bacterium]